MARTDPWNATSDMENMRKKETFWKVSSLQVVYYLIQWKREANTVRSKTSTSQCSNYNTVSTIAMWQEISQISREKPSKA